VKRIISSYELEIESHHKGEPGECEAAEQIRNVSRGEQPDLEQGEIENWKLGQTFEEKEEDDENST